MDLNNELDNIKRELSSLIILHLKQNEIDPETAKAQAADFLAILPIKDQKDLLEKLKKLGDKYSEARQVYLEEITKIYDLNRSEALLQMRNAIKLGNIDHAIEVAKSLRNKLGG